MWKGCLYMISACGGLNRFKRAAKASFLQLPGRNLMNPSRFSFFGPICALIVSPAAAGEVMLQYYESRWETIEKKTADAFVAGYSSYWLPPPGKADSGGHSVGYDVYDRFNLGKPFDRTLYGTEQEARQLVRCAHRAGMKVYFDYVANHNGFRDSSTPDFVPSGDYPGFVTSLPYDVDGDFHGASQGGTIYERLSGLIDIAQEKNHVFIRQPAVADPLNIPHETPELSNRRFYPDLSLPASPQGVHPFNSSDPLAGDPVEENATGLLLRNARWMIEVIGADGFRLDAVKHVPVWFWNDFYDAALYRRGPADLAGNSTTPFSFGEVFTSDFAELGAYLRKDGYGNRDVLDFPLFFSMRDVLSAGGYGDMRSLEHASVDAIDGNSNDGSVGVTFVHSHDEFGPALDNVAYAHTLTRAGLPIVYFNAQEFGAGRDFPKPGRGDALGGDSGSLLPRLVDVSRRYARGGHRTRSIDTDVYVYERSNSLLVGLNDRGDSGYDERTVDTDFRNTTLVELSGTADDPVVSPAGEIFRTVAVGSDGKATIRVPRNRTGTVQHNNGFVMYGLAVPEQIQEVSPVTCTLPPESAAVANGVRRHTPLQVITSTTFSVTLQTTGTQAEDNALVRLDGGTDFDANPGLFISTGEFAGFEQFTGLSSPKASGGSGLYNVVVDTAALSEGMHFLETVAFRPRPAGDPPAYSSRRSVIYLDRTPPPVTLTLPGTTGTSDVQSQSYTVVATCPDLTADSMHVFFDQPAGFDFLAHVNNSNRMTRIDRGEFLYAWNNITPGSHSITIVAFEPTGSSSITRFEPVGAVLPLPNMMFGVDTDPSAGGVNFQPIPATVTTRAYPHQFVVRVDTTGGLSFPDDFEVLLEIDGQLFEAAAYHSSLLPPVNRLVQNDQTFGDEFDEFRLLWRGYGHGTHHVIARARLKDGSAPANEVPRMIDVPTGVAGPPLLIHAPDSGSSLDKPTSIAVTIVTDSTAESVQAFLSQPHGAAPYRLIGMQNDPASFPVDLSQTVSSYLETDELSGLQIESGTYTVRAVAATGLNGSGISSEATTTFSVTGYTGSPASSSPQVDGDPGEFFLLPPLAVSAADGAGNSAVVGDFGADGSLTEFRGRVWRNGLYLAVRGDLFNGSDPNNNATIIYVDVDATSATGVTKISSTSDLQDSSTPERGLVTNSGFTLSPGLVDAGIGFDAAIILNGTSPIVAKAYGFGTAGVPGMTTTLAELSASLAFSRSIGSYPAAPGTTIAGPSGFEVAIPLAQLGNPNPRDLAFAIVTTSDTSFPSPNTLPENVQNSFDGLQVLDSVARFPMPAALLINEVSNGDPDWVEVYNPGGTAVSLENWSLSWSDSSGAGAILSLSGGSVSPGAHVLAHNGSPAPAPPAGSVGLSANIPWHPSRSGAAALLDPYGVATDYVRWSTVAGVTSSEAVPAGTTFTGSASGFDSAAPRTLSRNAASTDSNRDSDWVVNTPTPGAVNPATTTVGDWMVY